MRFSMHFVCLEDITHGAGIRSNSGQRFHRPLFWRLKLALQPAYYLICFQGIRPLAIETLERALGGDWFAVTPAGSRLTVVVTAPSEEEVREKFSWTIRRWIEILASDGWPAMKEAAN